MEGRASNFQELLADFQTRLRGAEFVAIDTELTGVDLEGEAEGFWDSAAQRLDKFCRVAERYTMIQLGLTLVGKVEDGRYSCASYNIFTFPYVGPELLSAGREPNFHCQASALKFNSQHNVNFNVWIGEGVPYVSREDEELYLSSCASVHSSTSTKGSEPKQDDDLSTKAGLLQLWKILCAAQLPLVVHTPVDLFFVLTAFESQRLPRDDPSKLASLIRRCFPVVYDTAHLHGALGQFRRLGLTKFYEDAKDRHEQLVRKGSGVAPLTFELEPETAVRYGNGNELAHEAGFDSLITAQLFLYLSAISPTRVREAANRLYLHRNFTAIDLRNAENGREVGCNLFDLSRVTLLVAELPPRGSEECDAPRRISNAGSEYKWIDGTTILVILKATGASAVRKVQDLSVKAPGVIRWVAFDEWMAEKKGCNRVRATSTQLSTRAVVPSRADSIAWLRGFGAGAAFAAASIFLSLMLRQLKTSRRRR